MPRKRDKKRWQRRDRKRKSWDRMVIDGRSIFTILRTIGKKGRKEK